MNRLGRYLRNGQVLAGVVIVGFFVVVAILAPQLAPPDDPDNPSTTRVVGKYYDPMPRAPTKEILLGTAPGQLDIYYSLVWGTRSALAFGLTVAVSTALFGILLGAFSGYVGGVIHGLIMRVTDAFLAFPGDCRRVVAAAGDYARYALWGAERDPAGVRQIWVWILSC